MFEKEFITHKIILFVALIFIVYFSGNKYLSEKNGISSEEGAIYAISNTSESLADSPYNSSKYEVSKLKRDIINQPFFISIPSIISCVNEIATQPEGNSILTPSSDYSNHTWVERSYYTNLLTVAKDHQFQYDKVLENCILTQRTPLYYHVLHTVSSIFGSFHLYRLGFFINIVFLFSTAFCLLTMGKKYFHSSFAGLGAALMYSLSLGCFSSMMCATPYIMVSFFLVLTARIHLAILRKNTTPIYLYQAIVFVNVIGNLTDYSYLLFAILLSFCFIAALALLRRPKEIFYYMAFQLASLLVTVLIYPATILHISTIAIESAQQFLYDFHWTAFLASCTTNLNVLNSQLFMHTGVLLFFVLLLLLIFGIVLNRNTSLSHLSHFFERMSTGDVADLFIPAIMLLYFVGITFFNFDNNYFILTTLLPFLALVVSHATHRLFNAIMYSESSSGMLGLVVTCILCVITITTSTPKYLYADTIDQTSFAASHSDEYCIFLSSDTLKASEHILELEKYEHSLFLSRDRLKSLKKDNTFLSQDSVIVYLSTNDYVDSVIDKIAKFGKFEIVQPLTDYTDENSNHVYIYQLKRKV